MVGVPWPTNPSSPKLRRSLTSSAPKRLGVYWPADSISAQSSSFCRLDWSHAQKLVTEKLGGALNFLDPVSELYSFDELCQPLVPVQPPPLLLGR